MKKLLYQFDTDPMPSSFDNVVAYDGGADQVSAYGGVDPRNVGGLVDGTIFTRAPKDKKFTAIFIGGSDMAAGEALLEAVRKKFFAGFRVSVMLDSNGSNTTAAAAVACLAHSAPLAGKKAVVLAGTGPVGMRAAFMLSREGAQVGLSSRTLARAQAACQAIKTRFGVEGIDIMDKGAVKNGKTVFGAIGFGSLKIALHRACIARLFESNDVVLDAEQIYAIAKTMVGKS